MKCLTSCLAHSWNGPGMLKKNSTPGKGLLQGTLLQTSHSLTASSQWGRPLEHSCCLRDQSSGFAFCGLVTCNSCLKYVRDADVLFMIKCLTPSPEEAFY